MKGTEATPEEQVVGICLSDVKKYKVIKDGAILIQN